MRQSRGRREAAKHGEPLRPHRHVGGVLGVEGLQGAVIDANALGEEQHSIAARMWASL